MVALIFTDPNSWWSMDGSTREFKQSVGLLDATMIVAGSMIGSGIFIVSAEISRNVGGAGILIAMWLLAGVVTVIAATSYGELSAMFPKAGGMYVYLREAFSPIVGFLYGWTFFTMIQTGTIAAVGVAFAKYTAYLFPAVGEENILFTLSGFSIRASQLLSISVIILLTYINSRGVKNGVIVQTTLTVVKIGSLVLLIGCGFLFGADQKVWDANWANAWSLSSMSNLSGNIELTALSGLAAFGAIAIAMKGTLFSCDSWHNVSFIAGEIKNPRKNIGLSLLLGTLIVTVVYLLANIMYLAVIPMDQVAFAKSDRVGVVAAEIIFGSAGTTMIAIMIMISTFGCNNGLIMAGARVYYTMAKDRLFFAKAGVLNKFSVPQTALWVQGVLASLWCLSGKYGDLLDMVSFVVVLFYMITIIGIFILRKQRPEITRPYKAFGYPILPFVYIAMGITFCVLLIIFKPTYTWPGLIITLAGIPIYYVAMAQKKKNTTA